MVEWHSCLYLHPRMMRLDMRATHEDDVRVSSTLTRLAPTNTSSKKTRFGSCLRTRRSKSTSLKQLSRRRSGMKRLSRRRSGKERNANG